MDDTKDSKKGSINLDAPKPDGQGEPVVIPTVILQRFEKLDKTISKMGERLGVVKSVNNLIVMVLFVLIIGVVLTAIYQFINTIKADTDSRNQLTDTVNSLKVEVEVLRRTQEKTTVSPGISPGPVLDTHHVEL